MKKQGKNISSFGQDVDFINLFNNVVLTEAEEDEGYEVAEEDTDLDVDTTGDEGLEDTNDLGDATDDEIGGGDSAIASQLKALFSKAEFMNELAEFIVGKLESDELSGDELSDDEATMDVEETPNDEEFDDSDYEDEDEEF